MPKLLPLRRSSIHKKRPLQKSSSSEDIEQTDDAIDDQSNNFALPSKKVKAQNSEELQKPKPTKSTETLSKSLAPPVQASKVQTSLNATHKSTSIESSAKPSSTSAGSPFTNDCTIYVEGLPFTSNQEEVRTFFKECGQIKGIRLPTWHDSGRLKGYGHVEFVSNSSVAKAFDLDGKYCLLCKNLLGYSNYLSTCRL